LPSAPAKDKFNIAIALNECYSTIIGKFFMSAPENIRNDNGKLKKTCEESLFSNVDSSTIHASAQFGKQVAEAVFAWSATIALDTYPIITIMTVIM
jgi:hypothetical protein